MKKPIAIVCIAILITITCFSIIALADYAVLNNSKRLRVALMQDFSSSFGNSAENKCLELILNDFQQQYPDTEIVIETVSSGEYGDWLYTSIMNGEAPDLFIVPPQEFSAMSQLDMLYAVDSTKYKESLPAPLIQTWGNGDELYAVPYATSPPCLLVNKNLLPEGKDTIDEYIFDWMDVLYYGRTYTVDLNKDGIMDQFGLSNVSWREMVYANGQVLFDMDRVKTNFSERDAAYMIKQGVSVSRLNLDNYENSFIENKTLIKSANLAEARYILSSHQGIDLEVLPVPDGPDGAFTAEPYDYALGIYKGSNSKKLAERVIEFITLEKEQQMRFLSDSYSFPVLVEAQQSPQAQAAMEGAVKPKHLKRILTKSYTVPVEFDEYYDIMTTADREIFQYIQSSTDIYYELEKLDARLTELLRTYIQP